jgi:peptide/nickel transport system substrate-binding protein
MFIWPARAVMGGNMTKRRIIGAVSFALVASVLAAACGGGSDSGGGDGTPKKGGTIRILTSGEQIAHLDPQRNYTGSDLAFAGTTMHRSLTSYKFAAGDEGMEITGDLATDTGSYTNDGKTWSFTLRDGITFEDGSAITCADVAYGVSRSFATDVITDGPTYAISYIDAGEYPGPYKATAEQQAAYDKAVQCDGNTITFNLKNPVADFNYTTTLLTFSPVPKAKDNGEGYDMNPVSSGPYKIESYEVGKALVLVRNENWNPESDELRKAYADSIIYEFGLEEATIDERMIADAGDDQFAVSEGIQPENLQTIFEGDEALKSRAVDYYDPYVSYTNLNNERLSCYEVRKAIYLALDRDALRKASGGPYTGDFADGFIKPALALDYAKSKMPEGLNEDGTANVEAAKAAAAEAKTKCPDVAALAESGLNFYYPDTPVWQKALAIWQDNLGAIGYKIKPEAVEASQYWPTVMNPETQYDIARGGWAPDWANASTVIPELFTTGGGFNLTRNAKDADYAEFESLVTAARNNLDRTAQGKQWQELNQYVVDRLWALPGTFLKAQSMWGSQVGNTFQWGPFGAFCFGNLYVK